MAHLSEMPWDEAMEYFMAAAAYAGHDPEELLLKAGVVEDIQENIDEIKEIQNRGEPFSPEVPDRIANEE